MSDLFGFRDYKKYLIERLAARGSRAEFARAVSCQTAYISQVLAATGKTSSDLSLEQAEAANQFFNHDEGESEFFLLLVSSARAGTPSLRTRLDQQREKAYRAHTILKNRVKTTHQASLETQTEYYSSWIYGAIHALASIPEFQNERAITHELRIDPAMTREVLTFLLNARILSGTRSSFCVSNASMHLPSDSPLVMRHHANWRLKALENLAARRTDMTNLHYSSVVSLSESDGEVLREIILKTILKFKEVIRKSPEETVRVFNLDYFALGTRGKL